MLERQIIQCLPLPIRYFVILPDCYRFYNTDHPFKRYHLSHFDTQLLLDFLRFESSIGLSQTHIRLARTRASKGLLASLIENKGVSQYLHDDPRVGMDL
jgi:hypothetical protein